jgi:hypothetical protein
MPWCATHRANAGSALVRADLPPHSLRCCPLARPDPDRRRLDARSGPEGTTGPGNSQCWPSGPGRLSAAGSRMGAARLGQAASDAVIVTLRRSLTWAKTVTWAVWPVEHCVRIEGVT